MQDRFNLIQVPAWDIKVMLTSTLEQLEGLREESIAHRKNIILHYQTLKSLQFKEWEVAKSIWDENDVLHNKYREDISNLWNRLLRKKFVKPGYVLHPGPVTQYKDAQKIWHKLHREKNLVLELIEECRGYMDLHEYAGIVEMTHEQFTRLEYFWGKQAVEDAKKWLQEI